jgi:hypothetical protein
MLRIVVASAAALIGTASICWWSNAEAEKGKQGRSSFFTRFSVSWVVRAGRVSSAGRVGWPFGLTNGFEFCLSLRAVDIVASSLRTYRPLGDGTLLSACSR